MANRSNSGSLTMQVKASQMCLRRLLPADTLCQQPPDDTCTCTQHKYRGRKKEPLVWKKCIAFNIKSTPTSTPLLRSLIMNNIFLCTSNRTCSKPTAFCATTQPEAESHAYCVYNNNISLQKGPDAILMHCFCLYCEKLFLVVVPLSSVSKPNKRELPKKQGCFVYNHFIDKSRNVDTLGPVELIVWPGQGNQGDWREQDDQGEVSIIIFGMSRSSGFQKYSI